jgi:hypothetical protein
VGVTLCRVEERAARPGANVRLARQIGEDPLHESTERTRAALADEHPERAPDADDADVGPRVGFAGRPIAPPRGPVTGLDGGSGGGNGFPSLPLRSH